MSNYTQLGFIKQTDGENEGSWGDKLNENLIDLLDDAIGGYVEVSVASGNVTLAFADGTADNNGRHAVIKFTGSPGTTRTVTFPDKQINYFIVNGSDSSVICTSGTGAATVTIPTGMKDVIYIDGSDEVYSMFGTPHLSSSGNFTVDATTDIILDADGGDIFFKDAGTTFGSATNTSGNLIIKSGTTTALTFSGANATLAGDLTISGDDLTMGTNTSGAVLVADGTNFNPVVISGDISIGTTGTAAIGSDVIVNADINSSAAIADSKLATISTADKVSGAAIQVDGATDGTSITLADSDKFLVDDGGTTKYINASQLNSYTSSAVAADDIGTGDGAITLATSSGNITIDAQAGDADIIFKGTDSSSDITALTLDMSEAGAATFNNKIVATELDISGNIDIDGTSNLDAVDIDGAVQLDATLTVGADDQGYDVKLFGDTASAYMLWDTSADDLILGGAAGLIVPEGKLTLGSTAVTSTAAELNLLDGVSGLVQADLTKLAAVDSTAAELNIVDGGTSATSTTLADADRLVTNDNGTMVQVALSDLKTYLTSAGFSSEDPTALAIALG